MTQWVEPKQIDIPGDLLDLVDGNELVASVLVHRGITTVDAARGFLDPDCYRSAPPTELPGMTAAADRLDEAIEKGELIGVWGDFDADGVTSTALLLESLRDLGGSVEFYIPDRATESHGVRIPSLQSLISRGIRVLLTCDTGSTDYEAISYARGQGVDVIVTDHHDLGPSLPQSNAFVNPKRLPLDHPLRELTGVGTAYKVAEELYSRRGNKERVHRELDLVAIGQVADIAVLRKDVRYLVQRGIEVIQRTERIGLQELMAVAGIEPSGVTEQQIGFGLGPRLNALGRLSEATAAVELFTTDDIVRARTIATEMEALNVERQLLCNQVTEAAISIIDRDRDMLRRPVLVVDHPNWPGGVIGIVAGRLAQRYNRPTIIISTTKDGIGQGSARSVAGVDIREAIAAQEDLLHRYGGHPMAAGLSLAVEDIPAFRESIGRTVSEMVGETLPEPTLDIAAFVCLSDLSLNLAAQIGKLAPFGAGNPPVCLATREVKIIGQTTIGHSEKHRRLTIKDPSGEEATVLWWHGAGLDLPEGPFDLAYTLHSRDFRGHPEIQLHLEDMRTIEGTATTVTLTPRPAIQITDHRAANRPRDRLQDILSDCEVGQVQVWGEGLATPVPDVRGRQELGQAEVLVVWTVPPGPRELAHALQSVSPQRVVLFDLCTDLDDPRSFLSRLTGLIKYDLSSRGGLSRIVDLVTALGHREGTVRKGIELLAARGRITVVDDGKGTLLLDQARGQHVGDVDTVYQELQSLLAETAAYRAFYRRADVQSLLSVDREEPRGQPSARAH